MKDWLIIHKTKVYVVIGLILITIYFLFFRTSEKESVTIEDLTPQMTSEVIPENQTNVTENPKRMMVDVKGAVKTPGVYDAKQGERIIDLVKKAGGFTMEANQNQVNLAQYIEDEMVIFVPSIDETGPNNLKGPGTPNNGLINLNIATESELQTLPGIGPAKAIAIIEFRETNGGFQTIEDLKKISGIGEKTYEKLEALISVK